MMRPLSRKCIPILQDCQYARLCKDTTQLSLLMDKRVQAKPTQCKVSSTVLLMRKEGSSLEPSKTSLGISKVLKMKK